MTSAVKEKPGAVLHRREDRLPLVETTHRLLRNRLAVVGCVVLVLIVLSAILAPVAIPYDPSQMEPEERFQGLSLRHPLGTDNYGRDLATRLAYGAQVSIYVGLLSIGISLTAGVLLGLAGGYYGGTTDEVIMRLMDAILAFPTILLALLLISALGTDLTNVMIAIGIVYTPSFARITRGSVLSVREKEFVEAARAVGVPNLGIVFRHILPNCLAPIIVQATVALAFAILAEASLSFLGLGAQPPTPSWGSMLSEGRHYMKEAPWMSVFPGLAIALSVFSLNVFGDGLRDALDPRLR